MMPKDEQLFVYQAIDKKAPYRYLLLWLDEINDSPRVAVAVPGKQIDVTGEVHYSDSNAVTEAATEKAIEFVKEALKDGPMDTNSLTKQGVNLGLDRRAIYQASKHLGVHKQFRDGVWMWTLNS